MPWWESNPKLTDIAKFSIIDDLTITVRELGRGCFGTVHAAVHHGKPCAAKQMHPFLHINELESFVRGINILCNLKHSSIVQYLGVYFKDKLPILIMELMWKNLYSLLEEQPNKLFLLTKAHILYDVACGLQYLHSQKKPVVHMDLHARKILLNENLNAKIADFGQAQLLYYELAQKLSTLPPGNIVYMAPEMLTNRPTYDTKVDVFSLGCTIIHLVTEKFPAPTSQFVESEGSLFQKISETDRRIEFLNMMKDTIVLQKIARQCLEDAPTNRPTAGDICSRLEKYIHRFESEVPELAKHYNKDKFFLLQLLQYQGSQLERKAKLIEDANNDKSTLEDLLARHEEYVSSLKSQCQDYKSKLEESEFNSYSLNHSKEILQKELTNLEKVNKDLNTTYKNQIGLLREDVKAKIKAASDSKIQMQNDLEDLQDKLSQQMQSLQNDMEKIKANAEVCRQEKDYLFKANSDYEVKVKDLKQQIDQLKSRVEEKDKQIKVVTIEKDCIVADLNEKMKTQEHQISQHVTAYTEYKSKYVSLQQEYKLLQETFQKQQAEGFKALEQDNSKIQMQNEINANQNLAATYKIQVSQLEEKIKTKEEEVINLKDLVKAQQEKINKGARKIKLLEAVSNSTNNKVHMCVCMAV